MSNKIKDKKVESIRIILCQELQRGQESLNKEDVRKLLEK